ncbi:XRE family transcriptional regulator [Streptomyces tendae]|uniref:XRE family transcriptional regulator n=1 Tax=Streptomyces tendae TaxID=1932 RepID=UPI00344245C5
MDTHDRAAERFSALVRELAPKAGFDLTRGAGGRAALARAIGTMSESAVGRMIDGKTLPMPNQFETIARILNTDVRNLLVAAEVISGTEWPEGVIPDVRSATSQSPLSPEAYADSLGLTDPMIRRMLISNINEAIRAQREATEHATATGAP